MMHDQIEMRRRAVRIADTTFKLQAMGRRLGERIGSRLALAYPVVRGLSSARLRGALCAELLSRTQRLSRECQGIRRRA